MDGFTNSLKEIGYQGVREGDLVIHAMDAFAGAVGVSDSDGKCSPVYSCCVAAPGVNPGYYAKLVRTMATTGFIESLAKGIRERSTDFRWTDFAELELPLPPLHDQLCIEGALNRETARIDALIEKKTRFIELLREKRQALITQSATRGLDPAVPMKDSGDDWLGQVPEHWRLVRFQRVVAVAEGQVDPEVEPYRSMLLLAPNHIESGTGRITHTETAAEQGAESGKYLCRAGDVVYSKIRPALRKACIAPEDCLCSADMYPLRGRPALRNQFLLWYLLSEPFSGFAVLEADRVAMPKINRESLAQLLLALPPEPEQDAICTTLEAATSRLDALAARTTRSIELLRERRAALITAAVTGQIAVRAEAHEDLMEPA